MKKAACAVLAMFAAASFAKGGGGHSGHRGHSSGSTHSSGSHSSSSESEHSVRGHVTKDGTYVQPHHATNPDSTKVNNWSSKPNVNPHTGQEGTKDPNRP